MSIETAVKCYEKVIYEYTRSQRQIVPSSQTPTRMEPSRLKLVCRRQAVHLGWVKVIGRIWVGSVTSRSHTYNFPFWFPSANVYEKRSHCQNSVVKDNSTVDVHHIGTHFMNTIQGEFDEPNLAFLQLQFVNDGNIIIRVLRIHVIASRFPKHEAVFTRL